MWFLLSEQDQTVALSFQLVSSSCFPNTEFTVGGRRHERQEKEKNRAKEEEEEEATKETVLIFLCYFQKIHLTGEETQR